MVTPGEGQVVTLIPGVAADRQQLPLSASTRAATLTWFVDGARIGSATAHQRVYWTPVVGKHEIVAADDAGHKARRRDGRARRIAARTLTSPSHTGPRTHL